MHAQLACLRVHVAVDQSATAACRLHPSEPLRLGERGLCGWREHQACAVGVCMLGCGALHSLHGRQAQMTGCPSALRRGMLAMRPFETPALSPSL